MKRVIYGIILTLLLMSISTMAMNIKPVKSTWTGTVYIRIDGRIDPPDAPISTYDNITYILTDNIESSADGIIVERDDIVIDGAGYTIRGRRNVGKGIDLTGRKNVTIQNIKIKEFWIGIYLYSSSNNDISGSNMLNNRHGMFLTFSSNNIISGNNLTANLVYGIGFYYSGGNVISGNNITENNWSGLFLEWSSNIISGNIFKANRMGGIQLSLSSGCVITGNVFINDGLFVSHSYRNSVENNTVNGKPLVYLEGIANYSVKEAGQVILVRCDGIRVENLNLSRTDVGVELWDTTRTTISQNNIASNWYGVYLGYSSDNSIIGNNITNNMSGVTLFWSSNNRIYYNNFINNFMQVGSTYGSESFWDNGYPSGGNYWSNYVGADLYKGPNQDQPGRDWIGDTPYIIDSYNVDHYPLIYPWPLPWGDWQHYHNYAEIVNTLLFLNKTFPHIVDVFSIGKSWHDRDIYCIRLTNETNTRPKPKLLFVGYHHARELISAELPLYFAVQTAAEFGINEIITHMLNRSEVYIIPALNVDGFEAVSQNEWQRKNTRPTDEDGDSLLDEDSPDDEDGDGYIEGLFYWDGYTYYFIRWEGTDDDGDGLYNEDWVGGVDLNRNYGYQWDAQCQSGSPYPWDEDYRGPAPFSEPETQAIRDLAMTHNFKYAISFHSGTESIGYPWGYTTDPTPDDIIFKEIALNLSALVGAPYGQNSGLYTASGMWDDWMYGNRSTFAFTCEIYRNNSAWQYEPGPEPNTWWEKGVFQFFNPNPTQIETVIQRWLPVFTYITSRAINEFQYHNIAITNITPLKTIVGQGYRINISVTVANQGDYTETFNVTLYANTTLIKIRTITLQSGESAILTFTWNTTGYAKGNYMLWAYAWPVPGETDLADNTRIDDMVYVGIPGDVDGNRLVEVKDLYAIARAYGAYPSDPRYKPNLDINDDNFIDIKDIYIAAKNYGKTDP